MQQMPIENLISGVKIWLLHFMAGGKRLSERWENAVHQVSVKLPTEKVIPMTIILLAAIILRIFFFLPKRFFRTTQNWLRHFE